MKMCGTRTATRRWVAVLLVLGCILPSAFYKEKRAVSQEMEILLSETLREGTDENRIELVRTACSLVGRVSYFWGGKSHSLGWDWKWGVPRRVTATGSVTTGHVRRYGLDCSGFVSWAAATSQNSAEAYEQTGEGVKAQYAYCIPVKKPQTGDFAFFEDLSHVGIVLGTDKEGELWVVHCSATAGGVIVSKAAVGFTRYGTPKIFLC